MKKILAILLTAALMVPCFAGAAQAATITDGYINSLTFEIDMSSLSAGSEPSEYDSHSIPVRGVMTNIEWSEGSNSGTGKTGTDYEGLTLSITDLECISTNNTFKVGDTAKFKFWVSVNGTNKNSKAFYINSSTAVHVKAKSGTTPSVKTVSKSRSGSYELAITVTSAALRGQYTEPTDLTWTGTTLGQAQWNSPEDGNNVGYYDVKLARDGHTVYTQTAYNATSINLYPWMTKEGDYTFLVRSVVTSSGSGAKNSEWVESDGQEVTKDKVSDGSGQTSGSSGSTSGKVGWSQVGTDWYYYYPDGTMKKNGWEKIAGLWYLFDSTGKMLKGWQTHNNNTYYLDPTKGDMKTGWVNTSDGQWYYLTPAGVGGTEGAMLKNSFLDYKNYRYYLSSSGAMATGWTKINQDTYYFRPSESNGCPKGSMVVNQRVDSFWLGADGKWVQGQ